MADDVKTVSQAIGLSAAKAAVMLEIRRLEKGHENKHANYMFASVDDFKDAIRPLMAKHGLSLHISEEAFDLVSVKGKEGKETTAAKITYQFTLEHVSGEASKPSKFTVTLPYTGAQTSGAAQSYAIKEGVYKGLFQASSGDTSEEADLHDQGQLATDGRLSKAEARELYAALQKGMADAVALRDSLQLADWWESVREQLRILPIDWFLMLKKDVAEQGKAIKASEDIDKWNPQK